jgi:hypothetical protein
MQAREDDQARTLLEAAVTICPQSQKLALQLIDLHVRNRRRDEALAVVSGFVSAPDRERLAAAVRGACLAQQQNWTAAADLLQAAMLDGCRERFCLRWLVVSWLALARPLDAQSALRAWSAIEPQNDELATFQEQIATQMEELAASLPGPVRVDDPASIAAPLAKRRQPGGPTTVTTGRASRDLADS